MLWILKNLSLKNGDIILKRKSYLRLWIALRAYFYKWLKSDETEFIIRKEKE